MMDFKDRFTRVLSLSLVFIAFSAVLTIAGGQTAEGGKPAEGQPTEVSFWEFATPENPDAWEFIYSEFEKKMPQVKLVVETGPFASWTDKLLVAGRAGQLPDVYMTGGIAKIDLGVLGYAEPLDRFLKAEGENWVSDFPAGVFTQWKGKLYAIPHSVSWNVLYYNTERFENAGLTRAPRNWQELRSYGLKLTNQSTQSWGLSWMGAHWSGSRNWITFLRQAGGMMFDNEGNSKIDTPEGREAFQFLVDLIKNDQIIPNWSGSDWRVARQNFTQGRTAMSYDDSYNIDRIRQGNPDLPYDVALQPRGSTTGGILYGRFFCIGSNSKQKDVAWQVLKFILSPEMDAEHAVLSRGMPLRKSNLQLPRIQNDPKLKVCADEFVLPNVADVFVAPQMAARFDVITKEMTAVVFGEKTTEEATKAIDQQWNEISESAD